MDHGLWAGIERAALSLPLPQGQTRPRSQLPVRVSWAKFAHVLSVKVKKDGILHVLHEKPPPRAREHSSPGLSYAELLQVGGRVHAGIQLAVSVAV